MLNFPVNRENPQNMQDTLILDEVELRRIEKFQATIKQEMRTLITLPTVKIDTTEFPISQKFSCYANIPYGKIGTIKEAGCGVLALEYALRLMGLNIDFCEIVDECVNKGYRAYVYDREGNIIDGSGTYYSLFRNLGIELNSLKEILSFLEQKNPVTILVDNSIYHSDINRKGNHYVTLIGIDEEKNALIMDGNLIEKENAKQVALNKKQFINILPGIKSAWSWNKQKAMSYLI